MAGIDSSLGSPDPRLTQELCKDERNRKQIVEKEKKNGLWVKQAQTHQGGRQDGFLWL